MTSDTVVLDVSRDWITACDVQERFMQHTGPAPDSLSYSARCRQVRALGGDFYGFMPMAHDGLALAVGERVGKRAGRGVDDSERAVVGLHRGIVRRKRRAGGTRRSKPTGSRILAGRPIRHIILRRFRWSKAQAAVC